MVFLSKEIVDLSQKYKEQPLSSRLEVLKELILLTMNLDGCNLPVGQEFVLPGSLNLFAIRDTLRDLGFDAKIRFNDNNDISVILS